MATPKPVPSLLFAIGSESRLKILLSLGRAGVDMSVYRICRATGLNRRSLSYHLKILLENRLVEKKIYGEVSLYTVNKSNPDALALIDFFSKVKLW